MPVPNVKGTWYMSTSYYCPLCGSDRTYRERMAGPAPEKHLRYEVIEAWDNCGW